MRRRHALALMILGSYFLASYLILHASIGHQRSMQRTVSASGQQRMYSQRIVLFADALVAAPTSAAKARARADLARSIVTFERVHRALAYGDRAINPTGWPPQPVKDLYFGTTPAVDRHVRIFLAHAHAVERRARHGLRANDPDLAYLLATGPGPLLASLDAVVGAYGAEQARNVARFEYLQLAVLVIGLSTLGIVWVWILEPLQREVARRTRAMEKSAMLDPLTGLLNRNAFLKRVDDALAAARASGGRGVMLMIDIDRFKSINDSYGHLAGDDTILRTAQLLRGALRAGTLVARLGGDEFAVYTPAFEPHEDARAFVGRVWQALQHDLIFDGHVQRMTASIGAAEFPADHRTTTGLLASADAALYGAKRSGRARYRFVGHSGEIERSASA